MATYVLVHGAWSGAHGFHLVRPLLRAEGHEVFTPSLTGIGERAHLVSPQVDLTTHITDVVNHILFEDLDDVVLLGFSYGGMVVTGALDHLASRVSHLVYLDAFVPGDGDTLFGLLGQTDVAPIGLGDSWLIPPTPPRVRRSRRNGVREPAPCRPSGRLFHRARATAKAPRRLPVHAHVHQGNGRRSRRAGRRGLRIGGGPRT